jgi:hypothetical protein
MRQDMALAPAGPAFDADSLFGSPAFRRPSHTRSFISAKRGLPSYLGTVEISCTWL